MTKKAVNSEQKCILEYSDPILWQLYCPVHQHYKYTFLPNTLLHLLRHGLLKVGGRAEAEARSIQDKKRE